MRLLLYMLATSSYLLLNLARGQLSCDRISVSFCCTTRIREQCPGQCAGVNCDDGFIHNLFSIDSPRVSQAKDGSAQVSSSHTDPETIVTKPDDATPFPTLLPPSQPVFDRATSPATPTTFATSSRRRTTPDPRIIRPPESLVVIGDYDEDEPPAENAVVFVDTLTPTTTVLPLPPPSDEATFRSRKEISATEGTATRRSLSLRRRSVATPAANAASSNRLICRIFQPGRLACDRRAARSAAAVAAASSPHRPPIWQRRAARRTFSTSRIHVRPFRQGELLRSRRKLDRGSSAEWKVSIIPRQQKTRRPDVNAIPALRIDGKSDERFNKFYRNFGQVFDKITKPDTLPATGSIESSASVSANVARTTVAPGVTNRVSLISATTRGPPAVAPSPQCGIAPNFTPCVSNEIASRELLACCQRKNLPQGCQALCRYDITQAEIRLAMDRGQCGIFNVAPFLECASQGKDNSECCRHRGIVQKTGPQCEQFCRPTQGLTALGIQHIVCGSAVGDMLHCHHSGVRI